MNACRDCMGSGVDRAAPSRLTREDAPKRSVLTLIRACRNCDGHGVEQRGEDRDLTRLQSSCDTKLDDAGRLLTSLYRTQRLHPSFT